MARVEVVAFDVNETLSDMWALTRPFTGAGLPAELRTAWFAALLRDGFALAAAGSEAKFADLASEALRSLVHGRDDLAVPVDDLIATGLGAFRQLDVHPDVAAGMRRLADGGVRLVTLTNGAASVGQG